MSGEPGYIRRAISSASIRRLATAIPNRNDPTWYVLGLSVVLFVGFSLYMSLLYRGFWLTGADFGSYVHMFATTLDGAGWLQQGKYVPNHPGGSYWGGHFSLTLLLFYPLYALVPSPYTLIVAKAFALAASVPVLWVLARDRLDSDRLAGLLTVSYALNPFLWTAWLFDFQEQVLLPLLIFGAYYAYTKRRYPSFLALLALVLLTNEFTVFVVGGFLVGLAVAAYRAGGHDRLRRELPVFAGGLALAGATHLLAGRVISRFSEFSGLPYGAITPPLRPFVEGARASMGELVGILLANPGLIVDSLAFDASTKVIYLVLLLVPVLFLAGTDEPALGALLPFVGFAWVFAGRGGVYYTFDAHYPLYLLPFVYIGAVRVLGRLSLPAPSRGLLARLFVAVLVVNVAIGVSAGAERDAIPRANDHIETIDAAIDTVPPGASLITQNDLYPHVATRENATFTANGSMFARYQDRHGRVSPDYVLFDTELETQGIDWSQPLQEVYVDRLGAGYGLAAYEEGIWVLRRGYEGPPKGITGEYVVENRQYNASAFIPNDARTLGGEIVASGGQSGTYLWYGPNALLPPGTYRVLFRMNVTRAGTDPVAGVDVAAGKTHQAIANTTVPAKGGPQNVTLRFTIDDAQQNVEFRGYRLGGKGTVALESVSVEFVSGPENGSSSRARSNQVPSRERVTLRSVGPGSVDDAPSSRRPARVAFSPDRRAGT